MAEAMEVKAAQWGVSQARIDKFKILALDANHLKAFMGFKDDLLDLLIAAGLYIDELYPVVQDHCNAAYVKAYAQLRQQGFTANELRPIRDTAEFLLGYEAGIPQPVLEQADKMSIPVQNLIDGMRADISFGDMFEIAGMRSATLYVYIQRRQENYSHKRLVQVLKLADPDGRDFDLTDYRKARQAGLSHDEVMKMLRRLVGKPARRFLYLEYVSTYPGLSHDEALALAIRDVDREQYVKLVHDLTHQQIIDGLDRGLSIQALIECVDFEKSNVRISFEEIVECYCAMGNLNGILDYITWVDKKFTYKEIDDVIKLGESMTVYGMLREESLGLSHEDVLMIFYHKVNPWQYVKLREEDMEHDAAMQSVIESQSNER
jgi:hypothetical protein